MKYQLILVVLMLSLTQLYTQSNYQKTKSNVDGTYFSGGLNQTNFLNPQFSKLLDNESLMYNRVGGFSFGINVKTFPVKFNINFFKSSLKVDKKTSITYLSDTTTIVYHSGWDIGASLYLVHFTKYFLPYIGASYHLGKVALKDGTKQSSSNTSSGIGKFGLEIYTVDWLVISGEYLRSLTLSGNNDSYSQYRICLSFKL